MHTHRIILVFCLLCPILGHAQTGYGYAGARSVAMAGSSVTNEDVFSAGNNQAGLAFLEQSAAGISTQNYFLVEGGINAYHGAGALTTKNSGAFGITLDYFGDNTLNQTKIGLGYGRKLAKNVALGVQLDYIGTSTTEIGSAAAFTFAAGVLYKPNSAVSIGAHVFNPIRAETGFDYTEELPAIFNLGLSYHPSDKIILCAQAEQTIDADMRIRTGIEYHLVEQLSLRCGYASAPSIFSAGAGVHFGDLEIQLAAQWHQQLGTSPAFGLVYAF
ncbi:MAG: hypothetical protein R2794_04930 [Chitinophagales bacterium]